MADVGSLRNRLEDLLSVTPADIVRMQEETADWQLLRQSRRVLLYGAGNLGRKVLSGLEANGYDVEAVIEGNPARHGTDLCGVPIVSAIEAFTRFGNGLPVVVCVWNLGGTSAFEHIEHVLRDAGFTHILSAMTALRMFPDQLLPHWRIDLPEKLLACRARILEAFSLWDDTASKELYVDQVQFSLLPTHLSLPGTATVAEQYVKQARVPLGEEEVLIDCGAYDGDTARAFIGATEGRFREIVSFEPDTINFRSYNAWRDTLPAELLGRISVYNMGVGDANCEMFTEAVGAGHSQMGGSGSIPVRCVCLDDFLEVTPTYIKMDIEGAEPAAIRGAANTIRESGAKLAICVYHEQDHLWEIPLQMKELAPGHTFHLEHHGTGPSDVVCYALP